jgi:3-methyl-2-oxobutanoate hydroxymethyltransferase
MLTAYDATMARLLDRAGIDVILVGDSLGTVILGQPHTLAVTLDAMIHHTVAVARGTERALVVSDMPFLTYQVSVSEAVRNAGRLLKEGGAAAVKLEGGRPVLDVVRRLVEVGIPVMGHLGLQPQSLHQIGGYTRRAAGPSRGSAHLWGRRRARGRSIRHRSRSDPGRRCAHTVKSHWRRRGIGSRMCDGQSS